MTRVNKKHTADVAGFEGIVSKGKYSAYRSGLRCGWVKVETPEWKAANQWRAKLFKKTDAGLR